MSWHSLYVIRHSRRLSQNSLCSSDVIVKLWGLTPCDGMHHWFEALSIWFLAHVLYSLNSVICAGIKKANMQNGDSICTVKLMRTGVLALCTMHSVTMWSSPHLHVQKKCISILIFSSSFCFNGCSVIFVCTVYHHGCLDMRCLFHLLNVVFRRRRGKKCVTRCLRKPSYAFFPERRQFVNLF